MRRELDVAGFAELRDRERNLGLRELHMNRLIARIHSRVSHRPNDEAGQGLAEYALILGLIAVVCIGALAAMGQTIATSDGFVGLASAL